MAKILIIDDDHVFCEMLSFEISERGHDVVSAYTIEEGLINARSGVFDIVFLDVQMPDGNGLDALPKIREIPAAPEIIIITGMGDPDGAELAIKNGAWDYIGKPSSINGIILTLTRALQYREERKAHRSTVALKREGIIGSSPKLLSCLDLMAQAADSDASVLISGETGTGKELFAWGIHRNSRRAEGNFVVVDCAALSETLVESILFGYEKGAFTGADKTRDGLVSQADGGTLFLDEVGELPLPVQRTFLRVLQERRFRPVGGGGEQTSDFRLVAATNRDMDRMAEAGSFRRDLLFRLRAFTIELPPLRERCDDVRELAMFHLARLCRRYAIGTKGFSPEFLEVLMHYPWPGNIRELFNTLERTLAVSRHEPVLFPKHLPTNIRVEMARNSVDREHAVPVHAPPPQFSNLPGLQAFRETAIAEAEKEYLQNLLSLTQDDLKKACAVAGLSRSRLYALMQKHGISKP